MGGSKASSRGRGAGVQALLAVLVFGALASALPQAAPTAAGVPQFASLELAVQVPHPGSDPDLVHVRATFVAPSGRKVAVPGFAHDGAFAVRFSPAEVGPYRYVIAADSGEGYVPVAAGVFAGVRGVLRGPVRQDPAHPRQLSTADGRPFVVLGETWSGLGDAVERDVAQVAGRGLDALVVPLETDCSGRFDDAALGRFDRLLRAAEEQGVYVVLDLGAPCGAPDADQRRLEYVLARFGASSSLLAVGLGGDPDLARAWAALDPYGHPVFGDGRLEVPGR